MHKAIQAILNASEPEKIHIQLCKGHILAYLNSKAPRNERFSTHRLLGYVLQESKCPPIGKISLVGIEPSLPPKPVLESIKYVRAFHEAVASLVQTGLILCASELQADEYTSLVFEVSAAGGVETKKRSIAGSVPWIPKEIIISSTLKEHSELYDRDLYLQTLNQPNINAQVAEFLADAVHCMQYELFRPGIVMLGAAVEGVWIELGRKVGSLLPSGRTRFSREPFLVKIEDSRMGLAAKQDLICQAFSHLPPGKQELWRRGELQDVRQFAAYLREDRNALHFNKKPVHKDSFTKTALLMLQTGSHVKRLYEVISSL